MSSDLRYHEIQTETKDVVVVTMVNRQTVGIMDDITGVTGAKLYSKLYQMFNLIFEHL